MTDEEIDKVLQKASGAATPVEPATLKRVADSLHSSLRPVRPLPPTWVLTTGLAVICAVVAVATAARAGFYGIEKMSLEESVLILSALAILVWVAGTQFVRQLIPASRQPLTVGAFVTISSAALLGVFALLFREWRGVRVG